MRIDDKYKIRSIAGENLIIMQGKAATDMTKVVSLNQTSVWLFGEFAGREFETGDVAAKLVDRYEIELHLAERDAAVWVDKLASCGIIIP